MNSNVHKRFQPRVEALEDRQLMAASLLANLSNGVLYVEGTEAADAIVVRQINNRISVDRVNGSHDASQVRAILVNPLGGDDAVWLNSDAATGQQPINAFGLVIGGSGNDFVVGGVGLDMIVGGEGDDTVYGNSGSDILAGNAGNDRIYGQAGIDFIMGDDGNDVLLGGDEMDLIYGGLGVDVIFGGTGSDLLSGDAGDDVVLGEAGHDILFGGIGNDRAYGGDGNDVLFGGAGTDRLYGEAGDDFTFYDAYDYYYGTLDGGTGANRWWYNPTETTFGQAMSTWNSSTGSTSDPLTQRYQWAQFVDRPLTLQDLTETAPGSTGLLSNPSLMGHTGGYDSQLLGSNASGTSLNNVLGFLGGAFQGTLFTI